MKPLGAADPSAVASYRLIGVLGGGGMGRVYLGESRTGRRVAIKVVREELAEDPVFRRRFAREVAAAKVVSPLYTAAVVDADPNAAAPWLATTYIDGPNLTELILDSGPLSPRAVLTLAAGLSEALASIHRVGLVHRDLKPSNVIINSAGPHIIDFGIALTVETTGRLTTSKVVGTPSYIAPEIIHGNEPTPAGDVFSLGATLVFAATGNHLVTEGTVYAQILQITSGRFDLEPIPKELRPLIVRCISPEPKDRPTADELAHILVASGVSSPTPGWYTTTEPAPVVLAGPDPKTLTPMSRRRLLAVGGLVGAATVGSAIGAAVGMFGRGNQAGVGWQAVASPRPSVTPSRLPPVRTGPGALLWDGTSGAKSAGTTIGAQQPGVRVIVDPPKQIIASDGAEVFAVDLDGRRNWTQPLPTTAVNLRPWGDAVLATDSKMLWLIDSESGVVRFARNIVDEEEVSATQDNSDNFAIEIGAIALATGRAFIGLGTAVIAIDRKGDRLWRKPRQAGRRTPAGVPRVANDSWVAIHTIDSYVQLVLRDAATGELAWTASYDPGPQTVAQGPPPVGPGGPGGTGGPGGPGGGPPDDTWTMAEGRFAAALLALRDNRAVRVLQLAKGRTVWQKLFEKPVAGFDVIGDLVVVAADKMSAYSLDSDAPRWEYDLQGARFAATPDGKRIIAATGEIIVSLSLTGEEMWKAPLPSSVSGMGLDRLTTDEHTAFLTFRPPPDQIKYVGVDTVAISIDG